MARTGTRTGTPTHLTIAEAAARLGCHRDTVRAAIRRGELPAVRIGRIVRVPADALAGRTEQQHADA